jgi:hypothetical protein
MWPCRYPKSTRGGPPADRFSLFGYSLTGSSRTLFLFGIAVGAVASLGLRLLLAELRPAASRAADAPPAIHWRSRRLFVSVGVCVHEYGDRIPTIGPPDRAAGVAPVPDFRSEPARRHTWPQESVGKRQFVDGSQHQKMLAHKRTAGERQVALVAERPHTNGNLSDVDQRCLSMSAARPKRVKSGNRDQTRPHDQRASNV